MFDIVITREPGRPCVSLGVKRVCRTTEEGGRQMRHRESDSLIVPVKAGNAAGGKEAGTADKATNFGRCKSSYRQLPGSGG